MIKGEKVILRPLRLTDWEKTIIWRNNLSIKILAMLHPFPITEMVEKDWYINIMKNKTDRTIYFTITNVIDEPIGYVTLTNINYTHRNCYLGIVIGDGNQQGKGYGSESLHLIIDYAFRTLNLNKISLEVVEINKNAIKLYERIGFFKEGLLKDHYYTEGRYYNVLIYSIFNSITLPNNK